MKKEECVIFDLDGTLALIDERRAAAAKPDGGLNWARFFDPELIALDRPNGPVIEVFRLLRSAGYRMVIFSGRGAETRAATELWLRRHGIEWDFMVMRGEKNYEPDEKLKREWFEKLDWPCAMVFDDRQKVVDMWRALGLTCFQVAEGNF